MVDDVAGGESKEMQPASLLVPFRTTRNTNHAQKQGLTLVHLSAQLEPCLTQGNTLHTLNTP
jgi:hypothetical protein